MSKVSPLTLIKLPHEVMIYHVLPLLTIQEVFDLCSISNSYLEEVFNAYMDIYMTQQKYSKKLADALYLLEYEYYNTHVIQYFTEYMSNLATRFVSLVNEVGGPIHFRTLEENPRTIYTIRVIMRRNHTELEYKFTSATFMTTTVNSCATTFSINGMIQSNQYIIMDANEINSELVAIFNMMIMDRERRITKIELNKEIYPRFYLMNNELPEIINISKYE
jgi:hypothetical protein